MNVSRGKWIPIFTNDKEKLIDFGSLRPFFLTDYCVTSLLDRELGSGKRWGRKLKSGNSGRTSITNLLKKPVRCNASSIYYDFFIVMLQTTEYICRLFAVSVDFISELWVLVLRWTVIINLQFRKFYFCSKLTVPIDVIRLSAPPFSEVIYI